MSSISNVQGLLEWRCVGPFRGGRVVTVAGDYHDTNVFYFGAVAGGVWKTSDAGVYWQNVSDGFFNTSSVGALAVAPSDSNVIYAGMGETTIRIDVSHGDGVYKSTDAGATWTHVGLEDTRHIGKIRVHPTNPDLVYVAALGHAFGPNEERGVYKSNDGGATWRKVLFVSEKAGAVDLSLDTANPRVLYAAVWQAYRSFSQISSGGPDSGLWQSTDGGETWTNISDRPGLPKGIKGKIAVATSPAQAGRVWALIEHQPDGGLYRSDDNGVTWERVSDNQNLLSRAWYYTHLTADPGDADTVYVNNLSLWKSTDGGRTFTEIATPHGDNHDLWIDPRNSKRMIQGNDGGACVSLNGALTWSSIYNQPTAQFYHLAVDSRAPYRIYGTQQDNSSISVPSRSSAPAISWADCFIAGTGESGYIAVRPDNPDIVYVGAIGSSPGGGNSLQRYDHRSRQIRLITTWPETKAGYGASELKYRFNWTYPIVISPHDPNVLYVGGNIVFKSINEGQSWEPISPDLSRADPKTLEPTGGPINRDSIGAETYATVFSFVESAHEPGVFWAGSDDGLLHLSKDSGKNWNKINPPDMPEWSMISCIELSPHDRATAYVAATRYKLDDFRPYLYKTTDYGATWTTIISGMPDNDFTRVIREDPVREGLLYVGTETGLYLSLDGGANWQRFQLNLPVTPIHDLLIKDDDLIAATHGRSFWILDDITPLRQLNDAVTEAPAHLFTPRQTIRVGPGIDWTGNAPGKNYINSIGGAFMSRKNAAGEPQRAYLDVGQNPPKGAIITYHFKEQPNELITLSFKDGKGNMIRSFKSKPGGEPTMPKAPANIEAVQGGTVEGSGEVAAAPEPSLSEPAKAEPGDNEPKIPAKAGWNRFVWDLRYPNALKVEGKDPVAEAQIAGPLVAPGSYTVALTVGEQTYEANFDVVKVPESDSNDEDLQAQFDLLLQLYTKNNQTIGALNRMRDLRGQLDGWKNRLGALPDGKPLADSASALRDKVLEIEKTLQVPDLRPGWADNYNNGVRLLEQLNALPDLVSLGDYRPTDQAWAAFKDVAAQIDAQIKRLDDLVATDLSDLNKRIAEAGIAAITPKVAAESSSNKASSEDNVVKRNGSLGWERAISS